MPKKENKSNFTEELVSKIIKIAAHFISLDKIEKILGLEAGCIEQFAKKSIEFAGKLENAALQLDIDVEMAIYKRAVGYQTTEEHKTYIAVYNNDDEEPILKLKEIKYATKFVPPETSSGLTWLYNKQGDKWSKNPAVSNNFSIEDYLKERRQAHKEARENL